MNILQRIIKNKKRAISLVSVFVGIIAIAIIAAPQLQKTEVVKPEGIAKEMMADPKPWMKTEKDANELTKHLRDNMVKAAGLAPDAVIISTRAGEKYFVADLRGVFAAALTSELAKKDFQLVVLKRSSLLPSREESSILATLKDIVGLIFPFILISYLVWSTTKDMKAGKFIDTSASKLRFTDVVGASEAKAALSDVVDYLKNPKDYAELGIAPPKGVLMLGGPGVGKTMLAKALAGESGAKFISASGSDFTSMYYGIGVLKVKKLFKTARDNAPSILFIDEMDGIAMRTASNGSAGNAESNRIINQVLIEMDGFDASSGVVVIGATNLPQNLDPALLREGRMDRKITVRLPDVRDREALFRLAMSKRTLAGDVDFAQLARLTTGLSPATLTYICNHSGLLMKRAGRKQIAMADMLEAIETARMGELNGTESPMTADERKRIAVHEAGHAIVAAVLGAGRVEKVTILPRGSALGVTLVTPHEDKKLHVKSDMENHIQVLLGGRNAELAVLNEASNGASQDLKEASRLAMDMVGRHGFGQEGKLFSVDALPEQFAAFRAESMVKEADQVLQEQNKRCQLVLGTYRLALDALTAELLDCETVSGERVLELLQPDAVAA